VFTGELQTLAVDEHQERKTVATRDCFPRKALVRILLTSADSRGVFHGPPSPPEVVYSAPSGLKLPVLPWEIRDSRQRVHAFQSIELSS
jgi:hypothetical protein